LPAKSATGAEKNIAAAMFGNVLNAFWTYHFYLYGQIAEKQNYLAANSPIFKIGLGLRSNPFLCPIFL
jgi:hypothetical protein